MSCFLTSLFSTLFVLFVFLEVDGATFVRTKTWKKLLPCDALEHVTQCCCASHLQSCAALRPNRYKFFIIGPVKQRVAPGDLIYLPACFPKKKNLEALVSCTPSDGFCGKISLDLIVCMFKESPKIGGREGFNWVHGDPELCIKICSVTDKKTHL